MANDCCKEEMHGRCCCNCRYHLKDNMHCTTVADRQGECVCKIQKGWVCAAPEFGVVYSGWGEHGMCECHDFDERAVVAQQRSTA